MFTLYLGLVLLLVIALAVLAVPFLMQKESLLNRRYIGLVAFICVFTGVLYFATGQPAGLTPWITNGQQHFKLQAQLAGFGGINGVIQRIEARLAEQPNDATGWFILGKLYLTQQNLSAALHAFTKAHTLAPMDKKFKEYYETTADQLKRGADATVRR